MVAFFITGSIIGKKIGDNVGSSFDMLGSEAGVVGHDVASGLVSDHVVGRVTGFIDAEVTRTE